MWAYNEGKDKGNISFPQASEHGIFLGANVFGLSLVSNHRNTKHSELEGTHATFLISSAWMSIDVLETYTASNW